jgi:hypothetical protein
LASQFERHVAPPATKPPILRNPAFSLPGAGGALHESNRAALPKSRLVAGRPSPSKALARLLKVGRPIAQPPAAVSADAAPAETDTATIATADKRRLKISRIELSLFSCKERNDFFPVEL